VRTRGTPAGVVIEVFNEGATIPATDIARLFQPYERGEMVPSAARSVGLGLFISSQIVEAHGGTITVDSSAGGTTFRVTLPR
jgi:signal transduction histidine kinase